MKTGQVRSPHSSEVQHIDVPTVAVAAVSKPRHRVAVEPGCTYKHVIKSLFKFFIIFTQFGYFASL